MGLDMSLEKQVQAEAIEMSLLGLHRLMYMRNEPCRQGVLLHAE